VGAVRAAVIVALAATTVAYPAWQRAAEPAVGVAAPAAATAEGASTAEVLTRPASKHSLPPELRATTSDWSRKAVEVSRSLARDQAEADCSGIVTEVGENGRLPESILCDLWQAPYRDRADAVVALEGLNDEYRAVFGADICLTSGYRTFEQQAALRRTKGGLAAPAGTSNHGWGLAVDICASSYSGDRGTWLHDVGPVYGWANPPWAHKGGSGPYEPWHWEFTDAVAALESSGLE